MTLARNHADTWWERLAVRITSGPLLFVSSEVSSLYAAVVAVLPQLGQRMRRTGSTAYTVTNCRERTLRSSERSTTSEWLGSISLI